MDRLLKTFNTAVFILIVLSVPAALGQRRESTAPADFYVQINSPKPIFYYDEYIDFRVMRRSNKEPSPNCKFGGSGAVQVLQNGNVIASFDAGPVSRLGHDTVRGVAYGYYGWGFGPNDFLYNLRPFEKIEIHPEENFQFRAICGDEISAPSRPFHISEWREPVDGLQVFVTPLKKSYKVGEPIKVKVTMRNTGPTPKRCPVPFPDDGYLRSFWALRPDWEDPRPVVADKFFHARSLKILKPGEARTAIFVLNSYQRKGQNKSRSLGAEGGKYLVWFDLFFDQDDYQIPAKYRKSLWRDRDLNTNYFEIVIE